MKINLKVRNHNSIQFQLKILEFGVKVKQTNMD